MQEVSIIHASSVYKRITDTRTSLCTKYIHMFIQTNIVTLLYSKTIYTLPIIK